MESEVREALRHLTTAFENHLEAVIQRRSPDDAAVDDTYEALAEAFERYEEILDVEYGEELPLVVEDDDEVVEDVEDVEYEEPEEEVEGEARDAHAEEDDDLEEFNLRD